MWKLDRTKGFVWLERTAFPISSLLDRIGRWGGPWGRRLLLYWDFLMRSGPYPISSRLSRHSERTSHQSCRPPARLPACYIPAKPDFHFTEAPDGDGDRDVPVHRGRFPQFRFSS